MKTPTTPPTLDLENEPQAASRRFRLHTESTWGEYQALLVDLMYDRADDSNGGLEPDQRKICKRTAEWHDEHCRRLKGGRSGWFLMPEDPDDPIWNETLKEFTWFGSEGQWDLEWAGRMRAFDRIADELESYRTELRGMGEG